MSTTSMAAPMPIKKSLGLSIALSVLMIVAGIIGMWESEWLGGPHFEVPKMFPTCEGRLEGRGVLIGP